MPPKRIRSATAPQTSVGVQGPSRPGSIKRPTKAEEESKALLEASVGSYLADLHASKYLIVGASPFEVARTLLEASKQITLIDVRPEKLEKVRAHLGEGIDLVVVKEGDEFSKFDGGSFCCVIFYDVLHHFPDKERVVREARRILRDGGHAFFLEPNISSKWKQEYDQFGVLKDSMYKSKLISILRRSFFDVKLHAAVDFNSQVRAGAALRHHTRRVLQKWGGDPFFRIYLTARSTLS